MPTLDESALLHFFKDFAPELGLVIPGNNSLELAPGALGDPNYSQAKKDLRELWTKGWTPAQVKAVFEQARQESKKSTNLKSLFPERSPKDNLLTGNNFHSATKNFSPPIFSEGQLVSAGSNGSKEYFFLEDVARYYKEKLGGPQTLESLLPVFRWHLGSGTHLDELLWAIDFAAREKGTLGDPWDLKKYLESARQERHTRLALNI